VRAWLTVERVVAGLIVLAFALTMLGGRRGRDTTDGPATGARAGAPRVGLVFDVGGRGDKSFNDAAYAGLERAQKELGIAASFLEPSGSEDREAAMRLFAAQGMDLVIGVGFIFSTDVDTVARDYPSVRFACVDYAPSGKAMPPNVVGLAFREEQGSFLVGAVAGLVSKTHHVGFVGGMTMPLIRKFEAGYEAGVRATCPACTLHSAYAGSSPDAFKDPAKGKALAIGEIGAGADVLFHAAGASGHGVFEAAHDARVWAIGVDSDQYDDMPDTVLTSMTKSADVAVIDAIQAVAEHRFEGGMRVLGLREHGIDYVHEGTHGDHIPEEVKAKVEALREQIIDGRITVPSR
jgi:basic membrane protein A